MCFSSSLQCADNPIHGIVLCPLLFTVGGVSSEYDGLLLTTNSGSIIAVWNHRSKLEIKKRKRILSWDGGVPVHNELDEASGDVGLGRCKIVGFCGISCQIVELDV